MLDHLPIGRDEEDLQPKINARLVSGGRERLRGHVGAGEDGVPAVCFFGDRDGFGRAIQRATPTDARRPIFDEHEKTIIQSRAVAILLVGEGVIAIAALEAREARCSVLP